MKALIVVVFLVLIISLDVLAAKDIRERPANVACLTCLELSDSTLQALETAPGFSSVQLKMTLVYLD